MKQNFAILAVTALLLCSLTACGGDQNNGAANGNVNGAENGTTSGMTGKTDSGSNVGGELKTDPATGTRYTGRENDSVVRYGNGYGNTSADKRAGTKNATANSTLHGSYNNPTGTPAGQTAAPARGMSNELRYRLMLETPTSMTPTAFCSTAKTRITTPSGEEYGGAGAGSGCFSAVFPR